MCVFAFDYKRTVFNPFLFNLLILFSELWSWFVYLEEGRCTLEVWKYPVPDVTYKFRMFGHWTTNSTVLIRDLWLDGWHLADVKRIILSGLWACSCTLGRKSLMVKRADRRAWGWVICEIFYAIFRSKAVRISSAALLLLFLSIWNTVFFLHYYSCVMAEVTPHQDTDSKTVHLLGFSVIFLPEIHQLKINVHSQSTCSHIHTSPHLSHHQEIYLHGSHGNANNQFSLLSCHWFSCWFLGCTVSVSWREMWLCVWLFWLQWWARLWWVYRFLSVS